MATYNVKVNKKTKKKQIVVLHKPMQFSLTKKVNVLFRYNWWIIFIVIQYFY